MEKLSTRKQAVLDVLQEQIEELEVKLRKVQPLIDELNQLKSTRRALLSEKGATSGAGNGRVQLSMEEMINYLRENPGSTPAEISEAMSVEGHIVRSHLSRGKGTRYKLDDGKWYLTEQDSDDDEDEE
jgi:hypothetical protein